MVTFQMKNIHKSFENDGLSRKVITGIDLNVEAGEFVAIVGRSGCGKSTLLRLIAGLEQIDEGQLEFGQEDEKNNGIRVMFQDSRLLPWRKVWQNVALGLKKEGKSKAEQVLEEVGLSPWKDNWPLVLSGGQKQRVALARALVHEPGLLLLDEPLGALDALTRIEMQQLIERIWQQRHFTALLVTHDVSEAIALADRIILIDEGKIKLDVQVNLPRPRKRGSSAFAELEAKILQELLGLEEEATHPHLQPVAGIS